MRSETHGRGRDFARPGELTDRRVGLHGDSTELAVGFDFSVVTARRIAIADEKPHEQFLRPKFAMMAE